MLESVNGIWFIWLDLDFFFKNWITNLTLNKIFQDSPKDEGSLLKAVQNVHKMIDKEIAAGTNPNNVFLCGFSQGGLFLSFSRNYTQGYIVML